MALRFDATNLTVVEPPVTLTEERDAALRGHEFSADGTMVHVRGGSRSEGRSRIVWVDKHGEEEVLDFPPPTATSVIQISPDGSTAVWGLINKSGEYDLWTHDLTRGTSTRVTFHPSVNTFGLWTPDGRRLVFCSQRDGVQNLYWKSSSGAGQAERLTTSEYAQVPFSISPDGQTLFFAERGRMGTAWQMWMLPLEGEDRAPTKIQESRYNQTWPMLLPDGRWLAYVSDESGREEVYVEPFPAMDEKWQISSDGGVAPVWGPDGRELFYMSRGAVMAVKIETEPRFQPGVPTKLFENPDYDTSMLDWLNFVVSKDGERFLLCKSDEALREPLAELIVVENWFEELKRLMPTD